MNFDVLDMNVVRRQILKAYRNGGFCYPWSVEEYVYLFELYYELYHEWFGEDHPFMTTDTISKVMRELPTIGDMALSPADYEPLIDRYFETQFDNCNYSLAHFVTGDIRQNRWLEVML